MRKSGVSMCGINGCVLQVAANQYLLWRWNLPQIGFSALHKVENNYLLRYLGT